MVLLLLLVSLCFPLDVHRLNGEAREKVEYVVDVLSFPDEMDGGKLRSWITQDRYPQGRLFIEDEPFTEEHMRELLQRTGAEEIPEKVKVLFGWTLRRGYMKMYPTDRRVHRGDLLIDYNLYTLLEPFTPLAVLYAYGGWYYVHTPYMRGWVKKEDVYIGSRQELQGVLSLGFLVVLKDGIKVGGLEWGMGSRMLYLEKEGNGYKVLLPDKSSVWVVKDEGLSKGFLPYSDERAKELLESLLGMPYGWGGLGGYKDCSAYVRDVFSVFGLELPRNSSQQALMGKVLAKGFDSFEEMEELLKKSPPYRTLLFMRGHVMVYGGTEEGDLVIYHAVHSLKGKRVNRVVKNLIKKDGLENIYKRIVSVNVLD